MEKTGFHGGTEAVEESFFGDQQSDSKVAGFEIVQYLGKGSGALDGGGKRAGLKMEELESDLLGELEKELFLFQLGMQQEFPPGRNIDGPQME